jgi:hypothetical protein
MLDTAVGRDVAPVNQIRDLLRTFQDDPKKAQAIIDENEVKVTTAVLVDLTPLYNIEHATNDDYRTDISSIGDEDEAAEDFDRADTDSNPDEEIADNGSQTSTISEDDEADVTRLTLIPLPYLAALTGCTKILGALIAKEPNLVNMVDAEHGSLIEYSAEHSLFATALLLAKGAELSEDAADSLADLAIPADHYFDSTQIGGRQHHSFKPILTNKSQSLSARKAEFLAAFGEVTIDTNAIISQIKTAAATQGFLTSLTPQALAGYVPMLSKKDANGDTILHILAQDEANLSLVKFIYRAVVKAAGNFSVILSNSNSTNCDVLEIAAIYNCPAIAKYLASRILICSEISDILQGVCNIAALNKNFAVIKALLEVYADKNFITEALETLMAADEVEVFTDLVNYCQEQNYSIKYNDLFRLEASHGAIRITQYLVDKLPDNQNFEDLVKDACTLAVDNRHVAIVKALLDLVPNAEMLSHIFMIAALNGDYSTFIELLEYNRKQGYRMSILEIKALLSSCGQDGISKRLDKALKTEEEIEENELQRLEDKANSNSEAQHKLTQLLVHYMDDPAKASVIMAGLAFNLKAPIPILADLIANSPDELNAYSSSETTEAGVDTDTISLPFLAARNGCTKILAEFIKLDPAIATMSESAYGKLIEYAAQHSYFATVLLLKSGAELTESSATSLAKLEPPQTDYFASPSPFAYKADIVARKLTDKTKPLEQRKSEFLAAIGLTDNMDWIIDLIRAKTRKRARTML